MKGYIHIEYINGKKETKEFDNYFVALRRQGEMLKNKKVMKNINSLIVNNKNKEVS